MAPSSQRTPEALLSAYYEGEDGSFAEFDRRQRPSLEILAKLLLDGKPVVGRSHEAEDIAQETLSAVAKTRDNVASRWDGKRPIKGWLTTILRNTVANHTRRTHGPPRSDTDCTEAESSDQGLADLAESNESNPFEVAAVNELFEALAACVEALPSHLQQAVEMHYVQELSRIEIARTLGVSNATITRRLNQEARQLLRECLKSKGFAETTLFS